jgi:hypothetical protein
MTKTHLSDAVFHLANAQKSLDRAAKATKGQSRDALAKMLDHNGRLLAVGRKWLEAIR